MQTSSVTLSRAQIDELESPCVYVASDKYGKILYIGVSENGYGRVFGKGDPVRHPLRMEALRSCDSLTVTFFDSKEEAQQKEDEWIHASHPSHNKMCSICYFYGTKTNVFNPDRKAATAVRHLKTADDLVKEFGGIPEYAWLVRNGYSSLYEHMRNNSESFSKYKRIVC